MNANPFLQPRFNILSFFIYRSGIPLLFFLYSLCLVDGPNTLLVVSFPVVWVLHYLVGKRAVRQPFWLLAISAAALPAAALVGCLGNPSARAGLDSALGRSYVVVEFQKNLETLLTVPNTCCLLVSFLLLWAFGSTLDRYALAPVYPSKEEKRVNQARVLFLAVGLALCLLLAIAFPALADLKDSLKKSGWNAMPDARTVSFSHPALHGRRLLDIEFDTSSSVGEPLAVRGGDELQAVYESVALELLHRQFEVTQLDTLVLWELFNKVERTKPGKRGSALLATTILAHNRHWDLGCTERLTSVFRTHTLTYLASPESTEADQRIFHRLSRHLTIHDQGGRERQDIARLNRKTIVAFGYDWKVSLPLLYYALDSRVLPAHAPLPPDFNPELEALEVILAIKDKQRILGELPPDFPVRPELGHYQRTSSDRGYLFLTEVDPSCRPEAVIEFAY